MPVTRGGLPIRGLIAFWNNMNREYLRQNGGAAAWTVVSIVVWIAVAGIFLFVTGCRSPIIEVNRNAPLINVQDSANGNTVPVYAAP